MCGITGIISRNSKIDIKSLHKMTSALEHRGPDGNGVELCTDYIGFGHTRLSIVDLTDNGKQPMSYNNRYTITYNGEIYNFVELKEELVNDGYHFHNGTDTEVILASYDKWGVDCLNKFNGMWAFVLYDKLEKEVFISRDRFGQKPLYYAFIDDSFIFGSEVKAIISSGLYHASPNVAFIKSFLKNGSCEWKKETAFENVFRFEKNKYFKGSVQCLFNDFKLINYWKINVVYNNEKFSREKAKDYAKKYYSLLKDAVRIRCRADVEVGSALSGGLDSSSIVFLVNQILKESGNEHLQKTFSSVYTLRDTLECDESEFINIVVDKLGVDSYKVEPQEIEVPKEHCQRLYVTENPPEGTGMSGWYTYKLVRQTGVTISLDGQGADEQLAGYENYIPSYLTYLGPIELLKEIFSFYKNFGWTKFLTKGLICSFLRNIFGKKIASLIVSKLLKLTFPKSLRKHMLQTFEESLVNLLHYADHSSMGNSIESRMPFLDYRLVEFLATVPECYLIHRGWTKYIARLAFDGKLPDEVTWRKDKMGWPVPEAYWFNGGLKRWLDETISSSKLVRKLFEQDDIVYQTKNMSLRMRLRLLNLARLDQLFFIGEKNKKDCIKD